MCTTLLVRSGGIGFNGEMPSVRGFEFAEVNVGILQRGEVAVKHSSRAHLAGYPMPAGDGAENFGISGHGHMIDEVNRLREVAFNPGAHPHAIALIELHRRGTPAGISSADCGIADPRRMRSQWW